MAVRLKSKQRIRVIEDPNYPGMRKLKLTGKELMNMPDYVFTLIDLDVLDLSPERESCLFFKLYEIPPKIGRLANLRILMVDTNELIEIPPELCLLNKLERLSLSNNNLSSLPQEFSQLQGLKSLHVANNKFDHFPRQVCDLSNLQFLDFSDNMLTQLPTEISSMENLESFYLVYNQLETLPDSLCKMVKLRSLWLGGNKLRTLPREFGKLLNLDWEYNTTSACLDGNPLQSPPLEVCKRGPSEISRYFAAAQRSPRNMQPAKAFKSPRENGSVGEDRESSLGEDTVGGSAKSLEATSRQS